MIERTLGNIAHNVQICFHQDFQDMSWDRASSPIFASAGHGERYIQCISYRYSLLKSKNLLCYLLQIQIGIFQISKNFNQIVHDTNIRLKVLEFLELIFCLEAGCKEKWQ